VSAASPAESVADEVIRLFRTHGDSEYGGEAVTQLEHALQAATLAVQQQASAAVVVAALLHDIGHLLHDLPADAPRQGVDDLHENLGARWLCSRFESDVTEPVRLHVAAKRYLCAVEPEYQRTLSEPSLVSLTLQGGPMSEAEVRQFEQLPFFQDAVQLRRFDDAAKIVGFKTPPVDHFVPLIRQVTKPLPATVTP